MEESDAAAASAKAPNGEASGGGGRPVEVEDTLPGVLRSFVDGVCSQGGGGGGGEPLLRRIRAASCETAPRLREASRNSARDLLEWTRRGSGLRAILVISVSEPHLTGRAPPPLPFPLSAWTPSGSFFCISFD
ncbi:Os08g0425800 [Oryza sativa Japonica Group]|jgi:hypothetical protein|uniref:Os08g0425800 protein n=1 Tax=Oryza sativa subsp. japonica TaxID=39947 RepID=A0A0P0XGD0_ORYSJ|nr:hypothetical protein EE612_044365 [Oryza sativa]BAT05504.1 Os08g0425800 [Oryza sativa Japonica Group]